MASPDFSQYIDLSIDDRDAADIYDDSVEYARLALPEFTPRVGTVEDSILQACALIGSLNIAAINRIPHGLMEGILQLMGVIRYEATFSTVEVEFTLSNDGETVPVDFFVVYEAVVGEETVQYPFRTTSQVTAGVGDSVVTATLTCEISGVIPTLLSGTELVIVQPNATVLSCVTTALVQQGDEPETDDEYFARATSHLASLSSSLVTATQIEEFIITQYPDVHRCKVYDLCNPVVDFDATFAPGALTGTNSGPAVGNTTADFISDSTFSDYTRVINTSTVTAEKNYLISGVYNTTASTATAFTFTRNAYEAPPGEIDVDGAFIDLFRLRNDLSEPAAGYFVIVLCDDDGNPISDTVKTSITQDVSARIVAGLSFVILDALVCDASFSVDISVDSEYSAASVVTNVAEELESFVSPANWPNWNPSVRLFDLVVRANSVEGVAYVNSVTATIPEFGDYTYVSPGNELVILETTSGSAVTGLQMVYKGSLPRATVEVTVS
jgi:hypothetical protein